MRGYLLKRIAMLALTVVAITSICFFILHTIPGDPAQALCGEEATDEQIERIRHKFGFDQPIYIQYFVYMNRMLVGDWGNSIYGSDPVFPYVMLRLQRTLELLTVSMIFSSIIGICLGSFAAMKRGSKIDSAIRIISIGTYAIPTFWLGLLLILAFSVYLTLLPSTGYGGIEHLALPAATAAAWMVGAITRISRASVLDVIGEDFVKTGLAKGLTQRTLLFRYILPNALIPIVTVIGLQFGTMIGGTIVTEAIFMYPGLGSLLVNSIFRRDYPLVMGAIFVLAMFVCVANLLVDILYTFLDPRLRYGKNEV
jgi:ABC-type dipeptide/oligopeptide/nickel transport system permease component